MEGRWKCACIMEICCYVRNAFHHRFAAKIINHQHLHPHQFIHAVVPFKITFPGNNSGIYLDDSGVMSYGTEKKRVDTGSNEFYKVNGTHDSNGLITIITVDK